MYCYGCCWPLFYWKTQPILTMKIMPTKMFKHMWYAFYLSMSCINPSLFAEWQPFCSQLTVNGWRIVRKNTNTKSTDNKDVTATIVQWQS